MHRCGHAAGNQSLQLKAIKSMTQWQQLVFQNGKIMAVFMLALPAFWLVILIAAPQIMMIDFSLWYEDNVTLERPVRAITSGGRSIWSFIWNSCRQSMKNVATG